MRGASDGLRATHACQVPCPSSRKITISPNSPVAADSAKPSVTIPPWKHRAQVSRGDGKRGAKGGQRIHPPSSSIGMENRLSAMAKAANNPPMVDPVKISAQPRGVVNVSESRGKRACHNKGGVAGGSFVHGMLSTRPLTPLALTCRFTR